MATSAHDEEAVAREAEILALHPGAEPKHLRAPLSTRIVLRSLAKAHGERELAVVGDSYVTAVVDAGSVEFYAGAGPVWKTASIETSRIAGVEELRQSVNLERGPEIRITGRLSDDGLFDLDFGVYDLVDGELVRTQALDADLTWWVDATGQ